MAAEVATTAAKTFKGVMLCERPADSNIKSADGAGGKYRPFLPTSSSAANEQLGLTPAYKELPKRVKRTDDAMSKHRRWLADEQYRLRSNRENDAMEEEERIQRIKQHAEFTAGLRATILSNKPSSHLFGQQQRRSNPDDTKASSQEPCSQNELCTLNGGTDAEPSAATGQHLISNEDDDAAFDDLMDFVSDAIAVAKKKDASTAGTTGISKEASIKNPESSSIVPAASRPKWAQTETEAAALENSEADDLIEFAAGLDIDKYLEEFGKEEENGVLSIIDEAERVKKQIDEQALTKDEMNSEDAMRKKQELEWKKRFVRAVNHLTNKELLERNAAAEDDTFSIAGESVAGGKAMTNVSGASKVSARKHVIENGEAKWDSSTIVDSEAYQSGIHHKPDSEKRAVAEDILRENPQLRSVHSMASVQAMISDANKTKENDC